MGKCVKCLLRVPYATLVATILCCVGVGVFICTLYRIVNVSARELKSIFPFRFDLLENVRTAFIAVGVFMALVSLIQLVVGILATGSTRAKVYRGWRARLGGRIACAVFMVLTYILQLAWIGIMICMTIMIFVFCVLAEVCNKGCINNEHECIDLRQFLFLFPHDKKEFLDQTDKDRLCRYIVQPCLIPVYLSFAASIVVVISLVHYLMSLSANYARIKDHEKLKDLQELQYLQDADPGTMPRDRF